MFKQFHDCIDLSKNKNNQPMKLEQFNTLPTQVVHSINPVSLDHENEENQLIKYGW